MPDHDQTSIAFVDYPEPGKLVDRLLR